MSKSEHHQLKNCTKSITLSIVNKPAQAFMSSQTVCTIFRETIHKSNVMRVSCHVCVYLIHHGSEFLSLKTKFGYFVGNNNSNDSNYLVGLVAY